MAGHHFISYSRLPEAEAFAFRLYDALQLALLHMQSGWINATSAQPQIGMSKS